MTWDQFREWVMIHHGYRFRWVVGTGAEWKAIWGIEDGGYPQGTGTGSGVPAVYGIVQRRRVAFWLRARDLVDDVSVWLTACEPYDDGWLVNDGTGIRWVADPESEALELARRGFIAIKCETEPGRP